MTPTPPASRNALRLIAATLVFSALAPADGARAQRGPASPPPAGSSPAARPAPGEGTASSTSPGPASPTSAGPASGASAAPARAPGAATAAPEPSDIWVDRPDLEPGPGAFANLLGEEFESKAHGIALRPPKDSVPARRPGASDFVEFVNKDTGWTLKVSKKKLETKGSLTQWRDVQGNLQPGMLEHTAKRLKEELPDAEFLRQEAIPLGAGNAAVIVLRHARNLKPLLSQQAIIERNRREYYLITLTTPGAPAAAAKAAKPAPGEAAAAGAAAAGAAGSERVAAEAFSQILDSVRLLDQQDLRAEQDARLFSTRALMANLLGGERIRKALVKERWTRVLKNGKDVGYSIVRERVLDGANRKGGQPGVEVAIRSRMMPSPDLQVDAGSIHFASMDMRHEDWSTLTEYVNLKQRAADKAYKAPQVAEFGAADRRALPGRGDDFTLSVTFESTQEQVNPVTRSLPPFHLPQAIAHLLPRLVPLNERKALLFTTWVPESREVVMRYVDVGESRRVDFNGELVRCVPVEERVGLEGSVTTHYVSHDGQWLGSENKESGIKVIPTTEEKLLKLWKDADLARPEAPARDAIQAEGPPAPRDEAAGEAEEEDAPRRPAPRVGERRATTRQPARR
jgi:hypothetical protein